MNKLVAGYFESKILGKEMLEKQLRVAMERMNLATREDLQKLSGKIKTLDKKVRSLENRLSTAFEKSTKPKGVRKSPKKTAQ